MKRVRKILTEIHTGSYLAGAIEHRGTITNNPLCVSLRTRGSLPKKLKKMFGGTVFKNRDKNWFRVKGKKAEILLKAILPFLIMDKNRVQRWVGKNGRKKG
jgi:hypothetical protein